MELDWKKSQDGLLPVVVQDHKTLKVLMLGYMNREAFEKTVSENRVTFYSRSKQRLWTKGETSNNYLDVINLSIDCDQDTILIQANAHGPTCHKGTTSCFDPLAKLSLNVDGEVSFRESEKMNDFKIYDLEKIIHQRIDEKIDGSYTYSLIEKGINKVAQKVGEEAVETVIEAVNGTEEDFLYEASDLMYHYLVLLKAKGFSLADIEKELSKRK
ncbi:MAG: bifunctional phosphoribosyl-AMP cyclohydrolase/phosphoribosyl-ATP diphosphatase HisIE [Nonlabens sp.]